MGEYRRKTDTYMVDVIAVGPSTDTKNGSGILIELREVYYRFQRWFEVPEAIKNEVLTVGVEAVRGGKKLFTRINYEGDYDKIRDYPEPIEIIQVCLKP